VRGDTSETDLDVHVFEFVGESANVVPIGVRRENGSAPSQSRSGKRCAKSI